MRSQLMLLGCAKLTGIAGVVCGYLHLRWPGGTCLVVAAVTLLTVIVRALRDMREAET